MAMSGELKIIVSFRSVSWKEISDSFADDEQTNSYAPIPDSLSSILLMPIPRDGELPSLVSGHSRASGVVRHRESKIGVSSSGAALLGDSRPIKQLPSCFIAALSKG